MAFAAFTALVPGPPAAPAVGTGPDAEDTAPVSVPVTTFGIFHQFMQALQQHVAGVQMGGKRCIYAVMRRGPDVGPDAFLPKYGITVGEFAALKVLDRAT
jgi:hypothetical protein